MQLFYDPTLESSTQDVVFSREESKHITKVLRKKEGDQIYLTNGKGFFFLIEIKLATPQKCLGSVVQIEEKSKSPYRLHLAVAPTKMNDRYEWFLEKATEIGIQEITPIICDNSERKVIKIERFERILQSAMKQSLQAYLPKLNPLISFDQFIQSKNNSNHKMIAHCEDEAKKYIKDIVLPNSSSTILIGPEGDFSAREIQTAVQQGYQPISLGNYRLRTETAAIVAVHSVSLI